MTRACIGRIDPHSSHVAFPAPPELEAEHNGINLTTLDALIATIPTEEGSFYWMLRCIEPFCMLDEHERSRAMDWENVTMNAKSDRDGFAFFQEDEDDRLYDLSEISGVLHRLRDGTLEMEFRVDGRRAEPIEEVQFMFVQYAAAVERRPLLGSLLDGVGAEGRATIRLSLSPAVN